MTEPISMIIIGCGGFGREVFCLLHAIAASTTPAWFIEGFADDAPSRENLSRVEALGGAVISSVDDLISRSEPFAAVIAIGSPVDRALIAQCLQSTEALFPPVVHHDTTVGLDVIMNEGVVIAPGARLSTNIRLGRHVQIDQNVTIGHDVQVGSFARLNPHSCISGSVAIGEGALIGANAVILPGVKVGPYAVVGAGACVTRDVSPGVTVKGVPARI